MNNKIDLESFVQEYQERIKNSKEKRYTLKEIVKEMYVLEDVSSRLPPDKNNSEEDHFQNYYIQKSKDFKEMIHAFDLDNEFALLKNKWGRNQKFSERNKKYIFMLFREYNGKFEPLKRGQVYKCDGEYILAVYWGMLDIFYDAEMDEKLIKTVKLKMWNRLDVPQKDMDASNKSMYDVCKKMISNNIDSTSMGVKPDDKIYWQRAFRYSFYEFIYKWDRIFEELEEIRKDEELNKCEEISHQYSRECEIAYEIEFVLSEEINECRKHDSVLQSIDEQISKLKKDGKAKKPLVRNIEDKLINLVEKRKMRLREVDLATIRKKIPDFDYPDDFDKEPEIEFQYKPVEEILEELIAEQKDEIGFKSLNDLMVQMKKYYP